MENKNEENFNKANKKIKRDERDLPGVLVLIEICLVHFAFGAYATGNKILSFIFFVCMILILRVSSSSWKSLLKTFLKAIIYAVLIIVIGLGACGLLLSSMN